MEREPGNSGERGRLGRQNDGGVGGSPGDGGNRPHPPEQYPGYERGESSRREESRHDDRGYRDDAYGRNDGRSTGGGTEPYREERSGGTGWGIAALVLAVLSFLAAFLFAFLNLVLALPAIILGFVARRKGSRGLGLAAIVISILAVLVGIVVTVLVGAVLMNSPEFQQILQEAQQQ